MKLTSQLTLSSQQITLTPKRIPPPLTTPPPTPLPLTLPIPAACPTWISSLPSPRTSSRKETSATNHPTTDPMGGPMDGLAFHPLSCTAQTQSHIILMWLYSWFNTLFPVVVKSETRRSATSSYTWGSLRFTSKGHSSLVHGQMVRHQAECWDYCWWFC